MTALHTAAAEPGAAQSRFAKFEDLKVHYTSYGEGPMAVVFIHGWSCDETVWAGQGPALIAQNIRAITIDLPGHGQSDKPQIDYTLPAHHPHSFTVDHVIPVSVDRAGAEDPGNLRTAHRSCNSSRGNGAPPAGLGEPSRRW